MKKERNITIDFLRGCACIFIILIHTAWWSGQTYLPNWFRNLFLFIDVPIFIFISGLSYNYVKSIGKNIKSILKQWNKWIFFLIFYVLILIIFFNSEFDYHNLINYIFYKVPSNNSLKVVEGSIWFIPMYIKVTIFSSIIIFLYDKYKSIEYKYILVFIIMLSMLNITFFDSYTLIYSFIYLLGYYSYKSKIDSFLDLIIFELIISISIVLTFTLSGYSINSIQSLKFPPTIYYLLISMPGILLVWYLKDKLKISKSNPINYLGKNAIFFYYSQGLSSSILYFILPLIKIKNIYYKFIIMAIINIVMAIILGIITNELYKLTIKLINKVKESIS